MKRFFDKIRIFLAELILPNGYDIIFEGFKKRVKKYYQKKEI